MSRARDTASFAFWGCLIAAAVYSIGAYLFRDTFVNLLGGSDSQVHRHAVEYLLCTVVAGGVVTSMNTLLAHLIRSEGRSLQSSTGIAIGGVLNIALDPLFMFVILARRTGDFRGSVGHRPFQRGDANILHYSYRQK